jgi:ABC-type multidrug transport system fused ATPase/permease subunit
MIEQSNDVGNKSSIYQSTSYIKSYEWHSAGKRLAVLYRVVSRIVLNVLWVVAAAFAGYRTIEYFMLRIPGLMGVLLALFLLILITFRGFFNNLFVLLSRKLSLQDRHDFILYRYHHGFGSTEMNRTSSLLTMAQIDLAVGNAGLAKEALKEIHVEKLNGSQMKQTALLWILVSLAENLADDGKYQSDAEDWFHTYIKIPDTSGKFPDNELVTSWMHREKQEEMQKIISGFPLAEPIHLLSGLLVGLMLSHVVFFVSVSNGLASGWSLRSGYEAAAAALTGVFVIAVGSYFLWLIHHNRKISDGSVSRGKKLASVIGGIAWEVLLVLLACVTFLSALGALDHQERILEKNAQDPLTHRTYTYLVTEPSYGAPEYYRAIDFMFMEEYEEARAYDTEWQEYMDQMNDSKAGTGQDSNTADDETAQSDLQQSTSVNEEDEQVEDDGFGSQNAMLQVFEYLQDTNAYPDMNMTFGANAKGDTYAVIATETENADGTETAYELRLYENGRQDTESGTAWEIVLEKVYPSGEKDTELVDFYLVNTVDGQVTDERKTNW